MRIVGLGLLGGLSLSEPNTTLANLEIGASMQIRARTDFNSPLAAHGSWVEVRSYGRCRRPYCDGSWGWTDRGWYRHSGEP